MVLWSHFKRAENNWNVSVGKNGGTGEMICIKSLFNDEMGLHNLNYENSALLKQKLNLAGGCRNYVWFSCVQIEGYLIRHTGTRACLAVAQRWHLVWKVMTAKGMSATHKQHSTLEWNRLCRPCGLTKRHRLCFASLHFSNTSLLSAWNDARDTLVRSQESRIGFDQTLSTSRKSMSPREQDSLFSLAPSLFAL